MVRIHGQVAEIRMQSFCRWSLRDGERSCSVRHRPRSDARRQRPCGPNAEAIGIFRADKPAPSFAGRRQGPGQDGRPAATERNSRAKTASKTKNMSKTNRPPTPTIKSVKKVTVQPGDILVITVNNPPKSPIVWDSMKRQIERAFGDIIDVRVVAMNVPHKLQIIRPGSSGPIQLNEKKQ